LSRQRAHLPFDRVNAAIGAFKLIGKNCIIGVCILADYWL
jgi:hypothetical protein